MPEPKQELTPIELNLMRAIWNLEDAKQPITTRAIYDSLPGDLEKQYALTTISTYLQRLIGKKFLRAKKNENREYIYQALVSREEVSKSLFNKAKSLFASGEAFVHHLVGQLSPEEQSRITELGKPKGKPK